MPRKSQIRMIQTRIAEAAAQWSAEHPKFQAFEERGQELRAQVIHLDGSSFGVFRFYAELSELDSLLACCGAYEQGQQQASSLIEHRHGLEPEPGPSPLALVLQEIRPQLLQGRTEAEQTIFHAWESHWQERERLLTGAANVWGRRSCGPLGALYDSYNRDELDALLAPYCL